MIRKTFLPSLALLSACVSAQAAETPKTAQPEHIVIPPLEEPEPVKLSGQCRILVERVEAHGLTLEQANELLAAARVPDKNEKTDPAKDTLDALNGKPIVRKNWSTELQEKWAKTGTTTPSVQISAACPEIIFRTDSDKGGWIKIKSPAGSSELSAKCLAEKTDADGFLPLELSLITGSRDAADKEVFKTNKGTLRVQSGVPLLLADAPELATPPTATTNPLIMRVVPGPDYEVKFLRISATYISPEEIYGGTGWKKVR